MTPSEKCSCCGEDANGTFGDDEPATRYPVCQECMESGKHSEWRARAIAFLNQHRNIGIETKGNLADDYRQILGYVKHSTRIDDGICPNGCARMIALDSHNAKCPVCQFQLYRNTGITDIITS